jgi:hypothetical protein
MYQLTSLMPHSSALVQLMPIGYGQAPTQLFSKVDNSLAIALIPRERPRLSQRDELKVPVNLPYGARASDPLRVPIVEAHAGDHRRNAATDRIPVPVYLGRAYLRPAPEELDLSRKNPLSSLHV